MIRERLLRDALDVWAPSWPRRVTRHQLWSDTRDGAISQLLDCEGDPENSPFISVYAYPDGHTKENNIPRIDTLFLDFDFEGGDYEPGSGDVDAWRRDISHLLVRVRQVAQYIEDSARSEWRASLSGHKGVHLYLDFPAIPVEIGDYGQFVRGLNVYAEELVGWLAEGSGLRSLPDYLDVTSADMGRLCRAPNTLHGGASRSFGEDRYCVPVTTAELAEITVDDYIEYTRSPRPVPWESRDENQEVGEHIRQRISTAVPGRRELTHGSSFDASRVEDYREESNNNIELSDVKFLTSDRPCVWNFHNRRDKFDHGAQSHYMELFCIREMIEHNVPIDVMKEFFANSPRYNSGETEHRIEQMIARDYNRFNVETMIENAPEFCGRKECGLCQQILNNA